MTLRDDIRTFLASFGPISEPEPERIVPVPRTPMSGTRMRVSNDEHESLVAGSMGFVVPLAADDTWRGLDLDASSLDKLPPAKLLELLADISPDISRALWDFLRLCNPGWEPTALRLSGSGTAPKATQDALKAFLNELKALYGSVDVVINRLFLGAFLRGAFVGELVLDEAGRTPRDIATPDPATIRFRQVRDPVRGTIWQPGQWQRGQWVALDIPTVRYIPIDPMPGRPEGRSPAAPALFPALFLIALLHDLRRVIQQQGYPRLDVSVDLEALRAAMPEGAQNDMEAFTKWVSDTIEEVNRVFASLQPDDTYVHTSVVNVNRPVGAVDASSLGAVTGLIEAIERQIARALKTMPLLMGTTGATTDTAAIRQWEVHAAAIKSIQHLAESLLEYLFTLAMQAQGYACTVQFRFAELRASEMLRDEQTLQLKLANASAAYQAGYVNQDEAAQMAVGHKADVPEPRSLTSGGNPVNAATINAEPGAKQ